MTKQKIIKFRAWTLVDYGNKEDEFYIPKGKMVFWDNIQGDRNYWLAEDYIGKEFILQQYTGLKDKNEKEIYEGDIAKLHLKELGINGGGEVNKIGVVEIKIPLESYVFFAYSKNDIHHFPLKGHPTVSIEIIGNIFENPDLLK